MTFRNNFQYKKVSLISGRITEVQQKRWKVDVNGRLDAVLQLSSVNLPGGELRRRSAEDELSMRKYLQEGKCCLYFTFDATIYYLSFSVTFRAFIFLMYPLDYQN